MFDSSHHDDFGLNIDEFVLVPCPVCKFSEFTKIKIGDRYGLPLTASMCKHCGLSMINPRPPDAWFRNFYRHDYRKLYESIDFPNASYISNKRRINKHECNISFISEHFDINHTKVLDIGSAEGIFLGLLKERFNCRVTGVEANINFAEFSKSQFHLSDIRVGDFFDVIDESETFDLIHCSHVFEHILDPNSFLQKCHKMLSDVGVLFIDVPDLFTSRTGLHYFHVAHVFYYSVVSLTNILNVNNFEVLSINNKLKFHAHKKPPWTIHVIAKKSDRPIPLKKFTYRHEDVKLIKKRWI